MALDPSALYLFEFELKVLVHCFSPQLLFLMCQWGSLCNNELALLPARQMSFPLWGIAASRGLAWPECTPAIAQQKWLKSRQETSGGYKMHCTRGLLPRKEFPPEVWRLLCARYLLTWPHTVGVCLLQIKYHEDFDKKKTMGDLPPMQPSNASQGISYKLIYSLAHTILLISLSLWSCKMRER